MIHAFDVDAELVEVFSDLAVLLHSSSAHDDPLSLWNLGLCLGPKVGELTRPGDRLASAGLLYKSSGNDDLSCYKNGISLRCEEPRLWIGYSASSAVRNVSTWPV
jgi:hypothetical protein